MLFDKLSIVVTDKCNAECEFCCLNCSPRNTNVRTEEELRRVIREAADLDGLKEICFTGGEPLLYMDLVETGAAFAKGLGLKSAVYTNGFWGSDSGRAGEWVQRLKAAGVYRIHFSADPWHQKYVPFSALKTAMRCSREAGLANELSVMEIRGSGHLDLIRSEMPEEAAAARVVVHPLLPAGRAKDYFTEDQILKPFLTDRSICFYSRMAVLNADGTYALCCSVYAPDLPKIRLGHMSRISAADLEKIVLADDYLLVMLKEGFGWYIQRMRETGREVPDRVCFPCVCCEMVFSDPEFMAEIADEVHERANMHRLKMALKW